MKANHFWKIAEASILHQRWQIGEECQKLRPSIDSVETLWSQFFTQKFSNTFSYSAYALETSRVDVSNTFSPDKFLFGITSGLFQRY